MNELHLFAGAGGGILAGQLLGHRTVCAVEIEPYPRAVLVARQNDGTFPPFPIWDDVSTFDGKPWRGVVDVVCGGFPCQDISIAGKGAGITGARSRLWKEFARIICEIRPKYAFVENSPMLVKRGLEVVLCDLAEMGYDAEWVCLSAAEVGAPHKRERIWVLATDTSQQRCNERFGDWEERQVLHNENGDASEDKSKRQGLECRTGATGSNVAHTECIRLQGFRKRNFTGQTGLCDREGCDKDEVLRFPDDWWQTEPNVGRVADGVAARVDRLKAIGNGQVPLCAATAFNILMSRTI